MNKYSILFILFIFLVALPVHGLEIKNKINGDSYMTVKNDTGRIGIGTTDPQSILHIVGNILTEGNLTVIGDYINATVEHQNITGNLFPGLDITYDSGSTSKRWNNTYSQYFIGDGSQLTGVSLLDTIWDISTSKYLFNNSNILDVNETLLNITIKNHTKGTVGNYLYNTSDNIFFNETYLNSTIDSRASSSGSEFENITVNDSIIHGGDTDTKISFGTDRINFSIAGTNKLGIGSLNSTNHYLDDKLLAYYSFDSNANDDFGTNNGAVTSASQVSNSKVGGGAYEFDGVDDEINFSTWSGVKTISFWANTSGGYSTSSYDGILTSSNYGYTQEDSLSIAQTDTNDLTVGGGTYQSYCQTFLIDTAGTYLINVTFELNPVGTGSFGSIILMGTASGAPNTSDTIFNHSFDLSVLNSSSTNNYFQFNESQQLDDSGTYALCWFIDDEVNDWFGLRARLSGDYANGGVYRTSDDGATWSNTGISGWDIKSIIGFSPITSDFYPDIFLGGDASASLTNEMVSLFYIDDGEEAWYWDSTDTGTSSIQEGWHHYVIQYNSSAAVYELYINGSKQGTVNQLNSPTGPLSFISPSIGATDGVRFTGHIDELGIFSSELDQHEIAALAGGSNPIDNTTGTGAAALVTVTDDSIHIQDEGCSGNCQVGEIAWNTSHICVCTTVNNWKSAVLS